jgi:hypothetical protein
MIRLLAIALVLFLPCAAVGAVANARAPRRPTVLYVSPRGSDAHSCRRHAPCRTLRRADSLAAPGTTIHVAPGHYGAAVLSASGTSRARIRWISDTRWGARISASSSQPSTVVAISGAYVDLVGFDVTGSGGGGTVGIDVAGNYSRAIGNRVHDLAVPCVGDGGAGIDLSGSHTGHGQEALRNLVTDVGSGPRDGWCRIVAGLYASVPGVKMLSNVVSGSVGDGITSWHLATHLTIANNTSTDNGGNGILIGGNVPPFDRDSYVVNNIAAFNYLGGIVECCLASPPRGGHYLDNLTYGSEDGPDGPVFDGTPAVDVGTLHRDPRFVNSAAGDYRLRAGSPAIGSGTPTAAARTDFDGRVRPDGAAFNRGAFSQWRPDRHPVRRAASRRQPARAASAARPRRVARLTRR